MANFYIKHAEECVLQHARGTCLPRSPWFKLQDGTEDINKRRRNASHCIMCSSRLVPVYQMCFHATLGPYLDFFSQIFTQQHLPWEWKNCLTAKQKIFTDIFCVRSDITGSTKGKMCQYRASRLFITAPLLSENQRAVWLLHLTIHFCVITCNYIVL